MRNGSLHPLTRWPALTWAFIRLGRPLFLGGGFVLHALGVAAALSAGAGLDLPRLVIGQIAITATQLMTHYANDYFDVEADRANSTPTHWSGGSRILVDGTLPPVVSLAATLVLAGIALGAALLLGLGGRPLAAAVIVIAVVLSAGYSAPPTRLHSSGFGEISAALVVAGLTPFLGYHLQTGAVGPLPVLASLSLLPFQLVMLIGVAFPDAEADAIVGKRTLVVRFREKAARLYNTLIIGTYALLPVLVWAGLPALVATAAALTAPLGIWQVIRVRRGAWRDPARQDTLAFGGIALLFSAALLEVLAFLALAGGY